MPRRPAWREPTAAPTMPSGKHLPGPPGGLGVSPHSVFRRIFHKEMSESLAPAAGQSRRRKQRAEKGCEAWGTRVTPQARAEATAPRAKEGLAPAEHPASLSRAVAAVPRLPPVPGHSTAPGQPDRDGQKSLPSRDRVAVAILTCSEQPTADRWDEEALTRFWDHSVLQLQTEYCSSVPVQYLKYSSTYSFQKIPGLQLTLYKDGILL